MALARALAIVLLCLPASALAQDADGGVPAPDAAASQPTFEPPVPIGSTDVPYPDGAIAPAGSVIVTVTLHVDATGAVQSVTLESAPAPGFDDAVIAAAKAFRFQPATYGGQPVPVEITFTHTFLPPAPAPPPPASIETGPPLDSVLEGKLVELGTRAPVANATVVAVVDGVSYTTDADDHGKFRLPLPAGTAAIAVHASSHNPFAQSETLAADQDLAVTYYVERDRYDPYEIVVVDEKRREEVSRVTLRGPELQQVPGTFGDPFRVIQALPGVASVVSLLPFPIVRGASPSSTGFLIDGTRVPLLYHLLSGPSVIHPEFIDQIDFYPGGAPAPYGGYTAGIVDGRTTHAREGDHLLDFDVNLTQAGGFVREPIHAIHATGTIAARYGYPGYLLSLATKQASLSYWDYQARLDGGTLKNGWTVFAFGARDELDTVAPNADPNDPSPPLAPSLILGFHRLDVRYHATRGDLDGTARVVAGYDRTLSNGTNFSVWLAEPELRAHWQRTDALQLTAGLQGAYHSITQQAADPTMGNAFSALTGNLDHFSIGSGYGEAIWRPTPKWLVRPGVRGDSWADGTTRKSAVDPRLTVRYQLGRRDLADIPPDSDDSAIWLKAAAGIYHQPPRFVLPLPGLDMMPLKYGLLRAYQSSLGVEVPFEARFQLSTEAYFTYMDPTIFDLSFNDPSVVNAANTTLIPTTVVTQQDGQAFLDRLTKPQTGRAYGLEVMMRRAAKSGVFGWISYTLSRSERYRDGAWVPYDFDRTHLLNLVAGLPLPRNWDLGLRAQYESGKPTTTTAGYNAARGAGYLRFDLRVDKHAVYRSWLLDFYVDITNVALTPEEVTPGAVMRYVLPTLGLRGRF